MIIFLKIPPLIDISEERDKLAPKFNPENYYFFSQMKMNFEQNQDDGHDDEGDTVDEFLLWISPKCIKTSCLI